MTVQATTLTDNLQFVTGGAILGDVSCNGGNEVVDYIAAGGSIFAGGVVEAENFPVPSSETKENIVGLSDQEALEVL
jgi:hypothetical protein